MVLLYGVHGNKAWSQIHENSFLRSFRDTTLKSKEFISLHNSYFASPFARIDLSNFFLLVHFTGDLKDKVYASLDDENSFGMRICNELTLSPGEIKLAGIKGLQFAVRLENVYSQSVFFKKDLYTLLFYGNTDMSGRTARSAPFEYQNINYQDLKFDFILKTG